VALRWTSAAYGDLKRIHEFLLPVNSTAAARSVRAVVARVKRIPSQPRLGDKVSGFEAREVRRVLVQQYEIRYEVAGPDIIVLRVFHTREDR
jgi:plasmid stabilization system protein ParE